MPRLCRLARPPADCLRRTDARTSPSLRPCSSRPRSNATYLEDAVGSVTDGVMLTSALKDYPASFAVSAAQDPGARRSPAGLELTAGPWGAGRFAGRPAAPML